MDRCPPEICAQIFTYACTDGGYTGRSLSLVSRYIHETSKPLKFQSISIHNHQQISSFSHLIESTPVHLRNVSYLLVSNEDRNLTADSSRNTYAGDREWSSSSILSRVVPAWAKRRHEQPDSVAQSLSRDQFFLAALLNILRSVSETLMMLTISFECHWTTVKPYNAEKLRLPPLPRLTDVSINYRAATDAPFNYVILSCPTTLPALRRLDISGIKLLRYQQFLYQEFGRMAPYLTHLFLPTNMITTTNVEDALPAPTSARLLITDGDPSATTFPSTLERIFSYSHSTHEYTCTAQPSKGHYSPTNCRRCRVLLVMQKDVRFVALESYPNDNWSKSLERAEKEWTEIIVGGEGCWDQSRAIIGWW